MVKLIKFANIGNGVFHCVECGKPATKVNIAGEGNTKDNAFCGQHPKKLRN